MRWLLFLGRVAFICNVFFLLYVFFYYTNIALPQASVGFIVVTGLFLGPVFCLIFNVSLITVFYLRKIQRGIIPAWLILFNVVVMILELIIIPFV